ncbi:MAG TPA: PP2C family protein-serine/threonine phosphatase [Anaerolineales bacterium]
MEVKIFDRFLQSLLDARSNLSSWLQSAPPEKKDKRFGPAEEQAVRQHLHVIDTCIEKAEANTLGLCRVCHGFVDTELLEMDYTASVCLDHYSEKERRQLEYELELAQSVQRTLLPQQGPDIPGLEVAAYSRPAQIVGGDYFDFIEFRHGRHGIAMADVAGHGMSASLHMASIQTLLRTLVPTHDSPAEVVQQVQQLFRHNIRFTTFVTLFLGAYDAQTRQLTYCSAGHNHPLVIRQAKAGATADIWLGPTGPAIGLVEVFTYTNGEVTLQPGDVLVIYTDGITEAFNDKREMFGKERLQASIRRQAHLAPRNLVAAVRREVETFTGGIPLEDDATLLVLKAG